MAHRPGTCSERDRLCWGCAFTLVEMLIAMGIVMLLVGLLLAAVTRARQSADSVACMANLREIASAFSQYALVNGGRYPDPYAANTSWEGTLRAYLPNKNAFRCQADDEVAPAIGSSYDWRDTPDPDTTLAGRLLVDVRRNNAVLAFEALPGWHAHKRMNAARVDGSVVTMDQQDCLGDLNKSIRVP